MARTAFASSVAACSRRSVGQHCGESKQRPTKQKRSLPLPKMLKAKCGDNRQGGIDEKGVAISVVKIRLPQRRHPWNQCRLGQEEPPWVSPLQRLGGSVKAIETPSRLPCHKQDQQQRPLLLVLLVAWQAAWCLYRLHRAPQSLKWGNPWWLLLSQAALVPGMAALRQSNLYDADRHTLFVYPALAVIAAFGFQHLWQWQGPLLLRRSLLALAAVLANTAARASSDRRSKSGPCHCQRC